VIERNTTYLVGLFKARCRRKKGKLKGMNLSEKLGEGGV